MPIQDAEYKILVEMIEEDLQQKVSWLKNKNDPHFKLYNAGQVKALEYVLELMSVNDDDREAM